MSSAAFSLLTCSGYLSVLGLTFIVAPNLILQPLGLPPPQDHWIYVVGMFCLGLAIYYAFAALKNLRSFFWLTCLTRMSVVVYLGILAALGWIPSPMLIFGAIDFAFGAWTLVALMLESRKPT